MLFFFNCVGTTGVTTIYDNLRCECWWVVNTLNRETPVMSSTLVYVAYDCL
jgi:hypothetical protein